jgi:hypothetical protein
MAETNSASRVSIAHLILVPSVITLAVTILRLVGELNHWSDFWFNPSAGGGGAPIGISWLIPIFGIYFAIKLARAGEGPSSSGRAIGIAFLGLVVFAASMVIPIAIFKEPGSIGLIGGAAIGCIVTILVARSAWPALFKTLLAYAFAARIPVAILMLIAIRGNWGTHYDVPPDATFPAMHWFMKWLLIGALPQMFIWIAITVTIGLVFGTVTAAVVNRRRQGSEAVHA